MRLVGTGFSNIESMNILGVDVPFNIYPVALSADSTDVADLLSQQAAWSDATKSVKLWDLIEFIAPDVRVQISTSPNPPLSLAYRRFEGRSIQFGTETDQNGSASALPSWLSFRSSVPVSSPPPSRHSTSAPTHAATSFLTNADVSPNLANSYQALDMILEFAHNESFRDPYGYDPRLQQGQSRYPQLLTYTADPCTNLTQWKSDGKGGCLPCPEGCFCPGGARCWPLAGH